MKAGVDLFVVLDCGEIIIEGAGYVAERGRALIEELAKCIEFDLHSKENLNFLGLVRIFNQFLRKVSTNPFCIQKTMKRVGNYIRPYVNQYKEEKCMFGKNSTTKSHKPNKTNGDEN